MVQFDDGGSADAGTDAHAEALEALRARAHEGDAAARFALGCLLDTGKGLERNAADAAHWFSLAAEQGQVGAQFNLAQCYGTGEGVAQDDSQYAHWLGRAAQQGDADAQVRLAYCHLEGRGVAQDDAQYVHLLSQAAEQGHARAQGLLGYSLKHGFQSRRTHNARSSSCVVLRGWAIETRSTISVNAICVESASRKTRNKRFDGTSARPNRITPTLGAV